MGLLSNDSHQAPYRDEHLSIDFNQQVTALDGRRISLTRKEFALLTLLVAHAGEIIPRRALLLAVWGYGPAIRTRTLDVHVRRIRRKLGPYAGLYLETIFGVGYRFQPFREPRFFLAAPAGRPMAHVA